MNAKGFMYCDLYEVLAETSFLLTDAAYRVITALITRLDYRLETTISVMSYRELAARTRKSLVVISTALKELEEKGYLKIISGMKDKEKAREMRAELYRKEQSPTRSYNEVSAYNLEGLIEFVSLYYRLAKIYDRKELLELLYQRTRQRERGTTYQAIMKGILIVKGVNIRTSDVNIRTSDVNIETSDVNIRTSDVNIETKPLPMPKSNELTHTPAPTSGYDDDLEGRTLSHNIGRAIFKQDSGQAIEGQSQAQDNLPSRTKTQTKTKRRELDDELRKFILDDLLAQEKEGKINSANAVMKRLTDEDIELYRQKLDSWKQEQEKQKEATQRAAWKVLCFSKDQMLNASKMKAVFGENWEQAFEAKRQRKELKEHGYYVYLKVKTNRVNDIIAKAQAEMIYMNEYELTKEYEEFFNS